MLEIFLGARLYMDDKLVIESMPEALKTKSFVIKSVLK